MPRYTMKTGPIVSSTAEQRLRALSRALLTRKRSGEIPADLGAEVVGLLFDENPHIRRKTAYLIASLGEAAHRAVPALLELLAREKSELVLCEVLSALKSIGPAAEAAVPLLIELLRQEEAPDRLRRAVEPIRCAAALALGGIGPAASAAAPLLFEALRREARLYAPGMMEHSEYLNGLAGLGPLVLPGLRKLLQQDDERVAHAAAVTLFLLAKKTCTPEILSCLLTAAGDNR